jgi:hypothetical protein
MPLQTEILLVIFLQKESWKNKILKLFLGDNFMRA